MKKLSLLKEKYLTSDNIMTMLMFCAMLVIAFTLGILKEDMTKKIEAKRAEPPEVASIYMIHKKPTHTELRGVSDEKGKEIMRLLRTSETSTAKDERTIGDPDFICAIEIQFPNNKRTTLHCYSNNAGMFYEMGTERAVYCPELYDKICADEV